MTCTSCAICPMSSGSKLVEKHLISRDLVERAETGAALIRQDRRVSVMINEGGPPRHSGHWVRPGSGNRGERGFRRGRTSGGGMHLQLRSPLGYLTSCPTNTGTGMRASVMLHLPMLTRYKQMGNVNQSVAKLGLTTRGIYGEGARRLWATCTRCANQVTLGRTEDEIIEAVTAVVRQLIDMEAVAARAVPGRGAAHGPQGLARFLRSYGLLRHALRMDEKRIHAYWSHSASWARLPGDFAREPRCGG